MVAVAGVQEGVWPDLRLRGSLLGSERLVDVLAGRAAGAGATATVVGQTSALLDEERRLFYVAVTRARRRLLVTAVASAAVGGADDEEQPSRFLYELGPTDRRPAATAAAAPAPTTPTGSDAPPVRTSRRPGRRRPTADADHADRATSDGGPGRVGATARR